MNPPLLNDTCPTLELLHVIGKAWTSVIILELFHHGKKKFNYFVHTLKSISSKELSAKLHLLETKGIIIKTETYALTEKGKELAMLLQQFKTFNHRWYQELPAACEKQSCASCMLRK